MSTSLHKAQLQEDAINRERALELASFIVEAPAGAGKTELLTQRYLKLLQTVEAPEEIVAITFTNKAAAEMRIRILDSLTAADNGVMPSKPHKQQTYALAKTALQISATHGWRLLENPARLNITTIDAFCAKLARQMPLLSRFGSQPVICLEADDYYAEAAQRTLEMLEEQSDFADIVAECLEHLDNNTEQLAKLLAAMLMQRDQWLHYTQQPDAKAEAEAALRHLVTLDLVQAAKVLPAAIQAQLMPLARYAAVNLSDNYSADESVALLLDWEIPLDPVPEALAMWRAVADLLLTNDDSFRKEKGINVKNGFPPTKEGKEKKQAFVDLIATISLHPDAARDLARVRHLPKLSHLDDTWHLVAALARLLNLAAAHLWTVFQEANEVDFIGIAQRALAALQDDTGATDLALKLDYRISHLLVDEFQDTSPTQVELLRRLTRGWTAGDNRTLFCVGDPMQSVYRFRKAEVGLFLRVAEQGIEELKLTRLKLYRNNRSDPALVDWINLAFRRAFPEEDSIAHGAIGYRPFEATRDSLDDAGVEIHPVIVPQGSTRIVSEVAEACRIADIIEAEQAENPERTIAVLVRARAHLDALVTEIRRKRSWIKFQAVEIEALQGRQSVQDVLALTHALHHRADRVHWLAILRAPWCGLTLADLHALAADDHDSTIWTLIQDEARLQKMSLDGQQRLRQVREVLAQALAQQGRQTVRRWIEGVWLMLNGPACLWEAGDVRDVQAFFDLIEQLEASAEFSLPSLEARMQKLYAAPDAEASGRLQFMTIHKSKGLEFDTVILPGLDRGTQNNQQDKPLLLWEEVVLPDDTSGSVAQPVTQLLAAPLMPKALRADNLPTPYDYIKALEEERAAHENLRVLYVAATRAERKLHLVATVKKHAKNGMSKPAASTHLGQLWESVGGHFMAAAQHFDEEIISTQKVDTSTFTPQLLRLNQTGAPMILQSPLTSFGGSDVLPAGDMSTECLPYSGDLDAIETHIGILAHRYVELIAQNGLQSWSTKRMQDLQPAMRRWLQQQGHSQVEAEQGAAKVAAALGTTLTSEQGRWVLQVRDSAASELAVAIAENDSIATHVIDRTFIENGERWIIDYKSAQLDESLADAALSQQAENYRSQLERYAAVFMEEGLPIRKAVFFLALGKLVELT